MKTLLYSSSGTLFSDILKEIMRSENLTQRALSDLTGVSEASISLYVNGKIVPTMQSATNILKSLGYGIVINKDTVNDVHAKNSKTNSEGYKDITAYKAIKKSDAEITKVSALMKHIQYVCELAGYSIQGEISLKNNSNGKVWKRRCTK